MANSFNSESFTTTSFTAEAVVISVGAGDAGMQGILLAPPIRQREITPFFLQVTGDLIQPVHFDLQTSSEEQLLVPASLMAISEVSELIPHRLRVKDLYHSVLPTQLITIGRFKPYQQTNHMDILASTAGLSYIDVKFLTREIKKQSLSEDLLALLFLDD